MHGITLKMIIESGILKAGTTIYSESIPVTIGSINAEMYCFDN